MYFLAIGITVVTLMLAIAALMMILSVLIGVPFLPTHKRQAHHMMALSDVKPGMLVVDLGSGAGRLLWMAAATGAHAVGYELNPLLYLWTRIMIILKGLRGKVEVHCKSIYKADLKNVDVVFAFLFPKPMLKLSNKLFSELKPGAKITSYTFSIPNHEPIKKEDGIFVYEVRAR